MVQYIDYYKHCKLVFGSYVEFHEDCKIIDGIEERLVGGIWLGTVENFQGRYKIFPLNMGVLVTLKQKIREILMPTWVVQYVEALTMHDWRDLDDNN